MSEHPQKQRSPGSLTVGEPVLAGHSGNLLTPVRSYAENAVDSCATQTCSRPLMGCVIESSGSRFLYRGRGSGLVCPQDDDLRWGSDFNVLRSSRSTIATGITLQMDDEPFLHGCVLSLSRDKHAPTLRTRSCVKSALPFRSQCV